MRRVAVAHTVVGMTLIHRISRFLASIDFARASAAHSFATIAVLAHDHHDPWARLPQLDAPAELRRSRA
jgi:hypothetical protein